VRHLARQLGVDLERVTGTGPDGLITRDDLAAVTTRISDAGPVTRIPIRGVRKHTAAAMVASAFTAPHVTVFHTIDVTPARDLATRLSAETGTRVGLLAIVSRAVCLGLATHPELNSRWEDVTQEIVRYGYVNLGIAAATDRGLVVPNVKDAGTLGLPGMAAALAELTSEARAGKATPERLTGGTFTITNIGVFGVEAGTPILNPGEAGILALGAAQRRPWEFEGGIALREVMTLSLSFDHRVVDGEQGSRFLAELGAALERADEGELS
jgi:pyruvate dehydrogenase E2 component (dihydrolipoamide acetyltransferase)